MTREMIREFAFFILLYWFVILGFGVFFLAIYYGTVEFKNTGGTILTLFEYTLNTFDFSVFNTNDAMVNDLGRLCTVFYLIFTAVILFNLLIAHMTSAYERVKAAATEEWSFFMAMTVEQFILLREPNALSTLPAPLNLLPIIAYPFQWIGEHYGFLIDRNNYKKLSIIGTISTIILTMTVGGFARIYAFYKRSSKCYVWYIQALHIILFPAVAFSSFLIYPFYKLSSQIQWVRNDDTMPYLAEVLCIHHNQNLYKMKDTDKRSKRGIFSDADIARICFSLMEPIDVQNLLIELENRLEGRFQVLEANLEDKLIRLLTGGKTDQEACPHSKEKHAVSEYFDLTDLRMQLRKDMELLISSQQSILDELRS
jgi:hypothetical protein